jgi:mRNA interferase MazF
VSELRRGEVWWGETPDAKARPYLVVTRSEAIPVLRAVVVAPVTRTVRGIPTEVPLGPAQGLPEEGVASFDNLLTFPKALLTRRAGELGPERLHELCAALRAATGC